MVDQRIADNKMPVDELQEWIKAKDPVNVEYILKNQEFLCLWGHMIRCKENGKMKEALLELGQMEKFIDRFNETHLCPSNVKVGDGVTIVLWSDRHAATIIKTTKTTVTVQRDNAILSPDFKPEFIPGGFAGTVINQHEQKYTYERDKLGEIRTFHWSEKHQSYGRPNNLRLIRGRHEFYDYNF